MKRTKTILGGLVAVALAASPAAVADNGNHGQGNNGNHNGQNKDKDHPVAYVFKGTYSGDGSTVAITSGNNHVRRAGLVGTSVAFDFTSTKLTVSDTNGDGAETVDDVAAGDSVLVTARLLKSAPGATPYVARRLIDQTQ